MRPLTTTVVELLSTRVKISLNRAPSSMKAPARQTVPIAIDGMQQRRIKPACSADRSPKRKQPRAIRDREGPPAVLGVSDWRTLARIAIGGAYQGQQPLRCRRSIQYFGFALRTDARCSSESGTNSRFPFIPETGLGRTEAARIPKAFHESPRKAAMRATRNGSRTAIRECGQAC